MPATFNSSDDSGEWEMVKKEKTHLEGSRFIPADRSPRMPELICARCGQSFQPHCIGEGVEELCCDCYEDEFAQSFDFDEAAVA